MKTLIINGSPRKNGDSMSLINEMVKHLDGDVRIINTYFDNISPCLDCRYCWKNLGCVIKDDMQEVYGLLDEVDNVILSSPLYFSELSGPLLSFSSRFQSIYAAKNFHKNTEYKQKMKNGVIIISGGGDGSPDPAVRRAKVILKLINARPIDTISSLKTNDIPAKQDFEALDRARELAIRLNKEYRNNLQLNMGVDRNEL